MSLSGLLHGCGPAIVPGVDAAPENDGGIDAAREVDGSTQDAGRDAGDVLDGAMEAGELDAGDLDGGTDAAMDPDADTKSDAGTDAALDDDAGTDAGTDAGSDAGHDGGTDAGPPSHSLTIELIGVGSGSVSDGGAIDCDRGAGATCVASFLEGAMVALVAHPDPGSMFAGWNVTSCGMALTCSVTMETSKVVSASFDVLTHPVSVTLTSSRGGTGQVTSTPLGIVCGSDCSETYASGTHVVLTAAPAAGSTFVGWTGDVGAGCSGAATCAFDVTAAHSVVATFAGRPAVRLSATDRDPAVRLRFDRLAADLDLATGGVRSDTSIAPGSGVFYFESRRLTDQLGPCGMGVASGSYPLMYASVGSSPQSFGISIDGGINYDNMYAGSFNAAASEHYGFVVDYRGATPTVYLIAMTQDWGSGTQPGVIVTQAMPAVTTPLFILIGGQRRAVEYSIEINPGNDTTNFPFHYDPAALLRAAGHNAVADALVRGWGGTYAGPADASPALVVSANQTVAAGTPVTVTATATDAEDGTLTSSISWELLSTSYYTRRTRGAGGSFSFTPTAIGVHPARATIVDSIGQVTTAIVRVTVTGPIAQHDPVILAPDALSGTGIVLSPDGLSARWTGFAKNGIRANQSCFGQFWYFESSRLIAPTNMGVGLVIGSGNLNPYDWSDIPPSMSVNVVGGAWRNLIPQHSFPSSNDHYGFAVDYRGEHPRVYVIVGGVVVDNLYLDDVWTEIYPMLYGNLTTTSAGSFDERMNFGATPFFYDPVAVLTAAGVDVTGLEVGWGDANTP